MCYEKFIVFVGTSTDKKKNNVKDKNESFYVFPFSELAKCYLL